MAGRIEKFTAWGLEISLRRLAEVAETGDDAAKGRISADQLQLAKEIEEDATNLGETTLVRELDRLCRVYDDIRRLLPSGDARTRNMTGVLVQMRALAPATAGRIDVYKSSGSAGSRLAAVAMMQMRVEKADITWLLNRFENDHPFVFYHAALAMQNVADNGNRSQKSTIMIAAQEALSIVELFDGEPDEETIEVLASILRKE